MNAFKQIPFFRICIPFVTGILIAKIAELPAFHPVILPVVLLAAFLCFLSKEKTTVIKIIFLICTDIFLFVFAVNLLNLNAIRNDKAYFAKLLKADTTNKIIVEISDLPVETARFIKCELKVLEVNDNERYIPAKGKLIGYFRKSQQSDKINFGKILLINSRLLEIEEPKNPFEFDYKNYMANRQFHYVTFADSNAYAITDLPSGLPALWLAGLKTKQYILSSLKSSGLTPEAYAISAALLTGYSHDIDDTVMEAFAHSGTLHVLSVSGLHTGLIYLVLAFIFDLFDRKKKYKVLKFLFITVCLWFFALVTGFSAPVLRAVIMFNLLGFGKIFFRNDHRNQLNILCVSAFALLCYDPFLLFDIGFQLSYFAMFGILFFQPVFSKLWQPENKFSNYIWQSISASFAATLTTLPFTLFYFKQFPLWFFICNLVVVPATFLVLLLAALVVLKITKLSLVINLIIKGLFGFINLFNKPGAGFIDNIHFELMDALIVSLLLIIISGAIYYRSYRYAMFSFILILVLQVNGIISAFLAKDKNLFSVYQVNKREAYSVKNKMEVLTDSIEASHYNYHVKPHLISFNYPYVKQGPFNYVRAGNTEILCLTKKGLWPQCNYAFITGLVVSNNFALKEKDLELFKNLRTIIADGSNNSYTIKNLVVLCNKFGIEFYNTRQKGAYVTGL
ncbi:MAG: ComEC/Rec2 family competence protein [Bacteroidia bacterium]